MTLEGNRKREYQLEWITNRRLAWIKDNGPCSLCGSSDRLEVDHVDRSTKSIRPAELWSRRKEVRDAELAKCQVLCYSCHKDKTRTDQWANYEHGTYDRYKSRGCRCAPCTATVAPYWREYRARKKAKSRERESNSHVLPDTQV